MEAVAIQCQNLLRKYARDNKSDEELDRYADYYQWKLDRQELLYETCGEQVVAFGEFAWIDKISDIYLDDKGIPTKGNVLYVDQVITVPKFGYMLHRLRGRLPSHQWIIWLEWLNSDGTKRRVHAPKGVPWEGQWNRLELSWPQS